MIPRAQTERRGHSSSSDELWTSSSCLEPLTKTEMKPSASGAGIEVLSPDESVSAVRRGIICA